MRRFLSDGADFWRLKVIAQFSASDLGDGTMARSVIKVNLHRSITL